MCSLLIRSPMVYPVQLGLLAHNPTIVGIGEGEQSRRAFSVLASANYFDVLGVTLLQGRTFTAEEERPGQDIPVTIAIFGHPLSNLVAHILGEIGRQRPLQIRRATEMVEQIGVGASDASGHGLQRDRLRTGFDQQIGGSLQGKLTGCIR